MQNVAKLVLGRYKGQRLYRDAILPYLDEKHAQQIKDGIIQEDDKGTSYPY